MGLINFIKAKLGNKKNKQAPATNLSQETINKAKSMTSNCQVLSENYHTDNKKENIDLKLAKELDKIIKARKKFSNDVLPLLEAALSVSRIGKSYEEKEKDLRIFNKFVEISTLEKSEQKAVLQSFLKEEKHIKVKQELSDAKIILESFIQKRKEAETQLKDFEAKNLPKLSKITKDLSDSTVDYIDNLSLQIMHQTLKSKIDTYKSEERIAKTYIALTENSLEKQKEIDKISENYNEKNGPVL